MGVLPGAPIHAALAQLPEALRSDRRGWGWKSLTRHQFNGPAPAAHVVQCRDGALKTRTVPVQIRPWAPTACSPIRRDVPLKTERLQVQVLPRGPIWNVNRSSVPGGSVLTPSVLTSACLRASGASPRHSAILLISPLWACHRGLTARCGV